MRAVIHIVPTAELAERVLLPGDPGRALRLAQALLDEPKMLNHNRGLWGYTGVAADGELLSIQSTGMGGPSAAIVVHELIELGARRLLRVGTCGGLRAELELGQLVIVGEALSDDGASQSLAGHAPLTRVAASAGMVTALRGVAEGLVVEGAAVSTDLFYDSSDRHREWLEAGALVVEMEAATIFTIAARKGAQAGCALLVSDTLTAAGDFQRIGESDLHQAELALGRLAAAALTAGC
jgi:DeoD family purine-nucleoside phosphorylase